MQPDPAGRFCLLATLSVVSFLRDFSLWLSEQLAGAQGLTESLPIEEPGCGYVNVPKIPSPSS